MAMMAVCAITLSSCSSDDDDNGNGGAPSGNGSALVTEAKVLLDYISCKEDNYDEFVMFKYKYDEQFRPYFCTELDDYDDIFYIDYKAGKLYFYDEDYENQPFSISFNSKGYITKVSGNYSIEDGEYGAESGSVTHSLSYDANGQLVAMESVYNEKYTENGIVHTDKDVNKATVTWKDGNMMKWESIHTYEYKGGERVYTGTDKSSVSFTYGIKPNKYRQYPGWVCDDDMGFFGAGLVGVGPKMLPQTITEYISEAYDGETYEDEDSYTGTFTLNEDGTINTEKWTDNETAGRIDQYMFHYKPVSAASSAKANVAPAPLTRSSARSKVERIRKALGARLFMPHRKSNR
ncbi:MAG: hypothetical protein ACI350_08700 [Prevotella sp.]